MNTDVTIYKIKNDYTVKQVCNFSGVSPRTLHYYDQIDLLKPSRTGTNNYRYYDNDALLRLQQILFFRELGLKLEEIRSILQKPDLDLQALLKTHKENLQAEQTRIETLISTIDETIAHLNGDKNMKENEYYNGFDEAQQKEYEKEIAEKYGDDNGLLKQSQQRWGSYSKAKREQIMREGETITKDIAAHIGVHQPDAPQTQADIARWHAYINDNFYDCSLEVLAGLGQMYNTEDRFKAHYLKFHPEMPAFIENAITHYCVTQS